MRGKIQHRPLGSYSYQKKMKDGAVVECEVAVFAMKVSAQRRRWPEYEQRDTRWFSPSEAAAAVQEPELATLIDGLQSALDAPSRAEPKTA